MYSSGKYLSLNILFLLKERKLNIMSIYVRMRVAILVEVFTYVLILPCSFLSRWRLCAGPSPKYAGIHNFRGKILIEREGLIREICRRHI
jgi:hypothetical protein